MSEDEAAQVRAVAPESPFRKLAQYDLECAVESARAGFERSLSFEEYNKQRGVVAGLQEAIALLNKKK